MTTNHGRRSTALEVVLVCCSLALVVVGQLIGYSRAHRQDEAAAQLAVVQFGVGSQGDVLANLAQTTTAFEAWIQSGSTATKEDAVLQLELLEQLARATAGVAPTDALVANYEQLTDGAATLREAVLATDATPTPQAVASMRSELRRDVGLARTSWAAGLEVLFAEFSTAGHADDAANVAQTANTFGGITVALLVVVMLHRRLRRQFDSAAAALRAAGDELAHQATHDSLTGLLDRAATAQVLDDALARTASEPSTLAVLYCDVDRLKSVNDALGHAAGDALLQVVAERLQRTVGGREVVGRVGGDEFVVVLDDLESPEDARRVAQEVVERLTEPVPFGDSSLATGTSVGLSIAIPGDEASTAADLVRQADLALYEAKRGGRGVVREYDFGLAAIATRRRSLESSLRHSLRSDGFELQYLPVVDSLSGDVVAAEALVRWPRDGRLWEPSEFFDVLEHGGLMGDLDAWVLRNVCRDAGLLAEGGAGVPLAINVSAAHLRHPEFADIVLDELDGQRVPVSALTLEVTEKTIVEDATHVRGKLGTIRERGALIAIDDFGSGNSSLRALADLPVDVLKIDGHLINELSRAEGVAIVGAIVSLADALGLRTIAEQVDEPEHGHRLTALGCTWHQGYAVARPGSFDHLQQALRDQTDRSAPTS